MLYFKTFLSQPKKWVYIAISLFFLVAIPTSINYTTADEHFWLPNLGEERILDYWRELLQGDFKNTQINDKPGITLAYLSGIAIPFTQDLIQNQRMDIEGSKITRYNPEITKKLHFAFRLPIILFIGFFSLYLYWILTIITQNKKFSALATSLILFSPVLLGISQIVNPDTLFWIFGLATILTFIAYTQNRRKNFVGLTTLFFGLSLASKYVAVIFIPFFVLILISSYVFFFQKIHKNKNSFSKIILQDIYNYGMILLGGVALFALMMPAAIVDPQVLYESTIGFPGMFPVFLGVILIIFFLFIDAFFFTSSLFKKIITFLFPHRRIFERILYILLLGFAIFVLFNWVSKNSIIDLSDIPYYAKTKASFTEENSFLTRLAMEFVPLVFALTPLTLFLLLFAWMRAIFIQSSYRFFTFILSTFFLVFYIAVVEQGLLVTVRYSIILFPIAIILGSLSFIEMLESRKESLQKIYGFVFIAMIFLIFALSSIKLFLYYHENAPFSVQVQTEELIGSSKFLLALLFLGFMALSFWIGHLYGSRFIRILQKISFSFSMAGFFLVSFISLFFAYPHFFLYMNTILPDEYVLNNPWGYGGYEAAQYLNALPDAENLTLWANAHGVCEFFVGNCIRSQKLDIEEYKVDYLFYAHRGSLSAKFETVAETVWEYYPDGRGTNYVRIQKNDPEASLENYKIKKSIQNSLKVNP